MRAPRQGADKQDTARKTTRRRNFQSDSEVEKQLEALAVMELSGVRWAWRRANGRDAPPNLGRDFLVRRLAYRLQAQTHGDLDRKHKRTLDRLAEGDLSAIAAENSVGTNLKPGTVLVREYKGELHQVKALPEGYTWKGEFYSTLSAVARAITGTNWNGYVFFGLKTKSPKEVARGG